MHRLLTIASQIILAAGEEGEQAAEEGHEAFVPGITSGPLVEWAWLIVVVPIIATFVIVFWGKKMPLKGWEIAWGSIGFVAIYGTVLFVLNATQGIVYEGAVEIAQIGDLTIEWGQSRSRRSAT